ncbi:MAG: hypothetical protein GF316_08260, partial [Candidatus Lokiarchaeota archaeon]|nr:hypothetical protein [Candidatus Lokiarchaeota archaeon]
FFDPDKISDVLENLLSNSIKYTPSGGDIKVSTYLQKDEFIIKIKDNGIGITKEEKKTLFQKFGKIERYGKGWDVEIDGTGLGLFISKQIIDLHDGNIWVESKGRDKGCSFFISLPIKLKLE